MNFPIRRLGAAGAALAATLAIFAIPASASAATPQRCVVVADAQYTDFSDWLCNGTSAPTYMVLNDSGWVYRAPSQSDNRPIARQETTTDGLVWTSSDGFGTRAWAPQGPGVWVEQAS